MSESAENYLEAILILHQRGRPVRCIDLADFMGYSKPSISHAVKELQKKRLVKKTEDNELKLTAEGRAIAEKIYEKHCFFFGLLRDAGIDEKIAQEDACKMEHSLSKESFEKLKKRYNELKN